MDERTFETLELKDLIALAARHVQTAPGRFKMLGSAPLGLAIRDPSGTGNHRGMRHVSE